MEQNNLTTEQKVVSLYMRTSKGVKNIAQRLNLPKSYVGKIINKINKSGKIQYSNYI